MTINPSIASCKTSTILQPTSYQRDLFAKNTTWLHTTAILQFFTRISVQFFFVAKFSNENNCTSRTCTYAEMKNRQKKRVKLEKKSARFRTSINILDDVFLPPPLFAMLDVRARCVRVERWRLFCLAIKKHEIKYDFSHVFRSHPYFRPQVS